MKRSIRHCLTALLLGLVSPMALAATDTTTFDVTATIVAACDVSATNLGFGDYDPSSGTTLDGNSTGECFLHQRHPVYRRVQRGDGRG
ncbi:MAG: spore coat protein U domain-containing protein [Gammaproteobacteria bacterium]